MPHRKSLQAGPEQLAYAKILEKGMFIGLVSVIITYLIYILGLVKPYIPLKEVPTLWTKNVHAYLAAANIEPGWAWVPLVGYSDFLNFVPIAILAGVTILCFLSIVPILWKQNDKVYAVLALLEVVILSFAASGILGTGGH